ncbi:MAG: Gfo/Idh/MocA family protein [Beutenbergiaceae bacterium]
MKELRVALIGGGGFMGRAHSLGYAMAPVLGDLGVRIHKEILVDITPEAAARAAAELGWNHSSADWHSVVTDPSIDIVDIVTPPDLHAPIAQVALAAGKHVFSEKPLTNDAAQAQSLWSAAVEAGVTSQVGFNYRHIPAITLAKKLLDSGKLGLPLQYRSTYFQDDLKQPIGTRWRARRATGGSGNVGDIGSHVIDIAEYLNGEIVRVTARVRARISTDPQIGWLDEQSRIDDDVLDMSGFWLAEFANGSIGTFSVSGASSGRGNEIRFELDGTDGAIAFNWNHREELQVSFNDDPPELAGFRTVLSSEKHQDVWYPVAGLGIGYPDDTAIQLRHFIAAIVENKLAHPNFAEGAHVQQVVEAIHRSANCGEWVEVPRRAENSHE